MARTRSLRLTSLGLALLCATGVAACGSSDSAAPSTTERAAATTTTTADATPENGPVDVDMASLRGVRYCEVLLLRQDDQGYSAEVWNTMGMSECPPDQWEALDADAIAEERGAVAALLNGPRFWTLDSIDTDLRTGAPETTFDDIGMFQAAVLRLGDQPPSQTPYTEREVVRDTVFGFDEGTEVYELVSPDGTAYVMQARSQIVDETLEAADLPTLGDRLELPEGWSYRARTLDQRLEVASTDGVAVVLQDELQNTYQRVDAT